MNRIVAIYRTKAGKGEVRRLRRNGRIPAILYGDGQSPTPLSVDAREFMKSWNHGGMNQLLQLRIEDSKESQTLSALLREVQRDPVGEFPLHIDFVATKLDHEIHIRVPLRIVGEHNRIKDGAVIEQLMHELDVSCLPSAIPERIEVDVSALEVGDAIAVKSLSLPNGIKIRSRQDEIVAAAVMPIKVTDLEGLASDRREQPVAAG